MLNLKTCRNMLTAAFAGAAVSLAAAPANAAVLKVHPAGSWTQTFMAFIPQVGFVPVTVQVSCYTFLQDALAAATVGDDIWVAAGSQFPDRSNANPAGTADRDASFVLKDGVRIYGGFVGNETAVVFRNPAANLTILDGNIGAAGVEDNSRSIVVGANLNNTTLLDGFTLRNAYRDATYPTGIGGAIKIDGGVGPVINNCVFTNNRAFGGAGIAATGTTGIVVTNCVFRDNDHATHRGGGIEFTTAINSTVTDCRFENLGAYFGGGIYANEDSSGTIARCVFIGNRSVNGGGLSFAGFSTFMVRECKFIKNRCEQMRFYQTSFDGGAVRNWCTGSTFVNCLFVANTANGAGGAIFESGPSGSSCKIINCTFVSNHSRDGGAVAATSGHNPVLTNSIMYNNTGGNGNPPATGNIQVGVVALYAYFVDPDGANNILGDEDDDFRVYFDSPTIDGGSLAAIPEGITTDLAGNPRVLDGDSIPGALPDLGAYEFVAPPPPFCNGDADNSGFVSFVDISTVLANFGTNYNGVWGPGDADNSGMVSFVDISTVLANFGSDCGT